MTKEVRWALAIGTVGATAVGLLVVYADRHDQWLGALTLACAVFLVVNALGRE